MAALLADLPYRIQDLAEFPGVALPPEGETSYTENALGKARAVTNPWGAMVGWAAVWVAGSTYTTTG